MQLELRFERIQHMYHQQLISYTLVSWSYLIYTENFIPHSNEINTRGHNVKYNVVPL